MSGGTEEKLVRMANQIATFFRSYPEAEAVAGVHDHIVAFWSPAMRRDLQHRVERDRTGVDPIVLGALADNATRGATPAAKEAAGPAEVGALGADDAG